MHFGESFHLDEDAFNFTFGCVTTETHLFYSQQADGILGLTRESAHEKMRPIFEVMKEQGLIEERVFALCLGKNGGYFQLGGTDNSGQIPGQEVQWAPMLPTSNYKVELKGISLNTRFMEGSQEFNVGFIDSGTTFTYVPEKLLPIFANYLDWFCALDPLHHCKGKRMTQNYNERTICFQYDEALFKEGPKSYFLSFPVFQFHVKTSAPAEEILLKWFPSEYLYREKTD